MAITYNQFVAIPTGTRIFNHGADECVALANHYHENVIGGKFIGVWGAHQWWTAKWPEIDRLYTKSLFPVAGAIFVSQGGIYDRTYGHIGIVTGVNSNGSFNTMEQNGSIRYVGRYTRANDNSIWGFLIPKNNPAGKPAKLEANQRQAYAGVGNDVKRREKPTTQSKDLGDPILAGTVGNFNGWIRGESVSGNNIWFRGISGAWFWSGGFTSKATTGLSDLNPKTPTPPTTPTVGANQRKVDPQPVNVRKAAATSAAITGELAANAVVTPEGWVTGQSVEKINIWYKVAGGYAWAGGFTKEDASGLKNLNPTTPAPVDPPVVTDPTSPEKDLGSPGKVLATIERWSESAPDFGTTNFHRPLPATVNLEMPSNILESTRMATGGFYSGREDIINHIVLHHAAQPNLEGALGSLMGQNNNSANWVIKDNNLVAMVDERDTPSTNGRWRSNQYSVTYEVCNDKTTTDKPSSASHETAAWVVARTAMRWGLLTPLKHGVNVFGHKEVAKPGHGTACPGSLDVDWIVSRANDIIEAAKDETPAPAPDYSDLNESISGLSKLIQSLIDLIKSIFKVK